MADLTLLAQRAFKKHFPKFGSAIKKCQYVFSDPITYNTSDGSVIDSSTPDPEIDMMFDKFKSEQIDGTNVLAIDKIAIFPTLNITQEPVEGDKIIQGGYEWVVKSIISDPMSVAYELHVRPRKVA